MMKMTSNKPYLLRAIYDWIVDNDLTPYILVNSNFPGVQVPQEYVNNGRIVLNISPKACRGLHLENDRIIFTARFSGQSMQIFIVPAAVLAIYAKENGQGMEFPEEAHEPPPTTIGSETKGRKPALTLVKKE
ncbi:stringent starvation protein B [Legionella jamestowniensis DSM 19215]|uniref:ClpXP protease specificity-enhancing factor n=2 Tax=Legionella jamestowniensis TaxID=455 RepID=A0A0W0UYQ7_9GAMM|nr:ClpXP protease specificity-enhancing factor [Legionella jamestowniensis]SFL79415.1 stringent starvation protein B [Legionella jamestowniensis DSM 19215]